MAVDFLVVREFFAFDFDFTERRAEFAGFHERATLISVLPRFRSAPVRPGVVGFRVGHRLVVLVAQPAEECRVRRSVDVVWFVTVFPVDERIVRVDDLAASFERDVAVVGTVSWKFFGVCRA